MLICSRAIVEETLAHIEAGAVRNCETAVLWLGKREANKEEEVVEVFRPDQLVDVDFFRISADGMRAMLAHLRSRRLQILGQVHSHPERAFHSKADDKWAIVRHLGAASLVVPWFGKHTSASSFVDDIAAFQLDENDKWREVPAEAVLTVIG